MSRTQIPLFERLLIESHSHYNRSCWFCPRTYDRSGTYLDADGRPVPSRMPTEKILGLLDEAIEQGQRYEMDGVVKRALAQKRSMQGGGLERPDREPQRS